MKTRFSSLVTLKKSTVSKSEQVVQKANANLNSATMALSLSYDLLESIDTPKQGSMADFLANRTLLSSQRGLIEQNKEWVQFSKNQAKQAKEQLKLDMIEHEKFKYLELEEIKKVLKKRKLEEAKALDEVALMTHGRNNN
jgi:flagellar biosynthesis chaperone FliJ